MPNPYNKSEEPINYPAGNSSAHFKHCEYHIELKDKFGQ